MHGTLIRHKRLRRAVGGVLVAAGALLMWLAPAAWPGALLLAAGMVLEIAGIALEHRRDRERGNGHAMER